MVYGVLHLGVLHLLLYHGNHKKVFFLLSGLSHHLSYIVIGPISDARDAVTAHSSLAGRAPSDAAGSPLGAERAVLETLTSLPLILWLHYGHSLLQQKLMLMLQKHFFHLVIYNIY